MLRNSVQTVSSSLRMVVSGPGELTIERRAAFFVVQMHEFLKKPEKDFLFFFVQRPQQAPTHETAGRVELFHQRRASRRELKQAKALAPARYRPLDKPTPFEAHRQIRSR